MRTECTDSKRKKEKNIDRFAPKKNETNDDNDDWKQIDKQTNKTNINNNLLSKKIIGILFSLSMWVEKFAKKHLK